MANRLLRDFTQCIKVNSLKAEEEVLFFRLWQKADDYGNFYANAVMLKSLLFPRKEGLRSADIDRWLRQIEAAALIRIYHHGGEPFLTILDYGQRLRQQRRMFPPPPEEHVSDLSATCQQLADNLSTSGGLKRREVEVEVEGEAHAQERDPLPPNVEASAAGKGSKKETLHANVGARVRGSHPFKDSQYYDYEEFERAFNATDYAHCDLRYYYTRMKNWAESKNERRSDWLATARNFMLGDSSEGKLRLKKQHGTGSNGPRSGELSATPGGEGRTRRV